jgi:hypothetical protein
VINNSVSFTGAVPESVFVQRVLEAVGIEIDLEDGHEHDSSDTTPLA